MTLGGARIPPKEGRGGHVFHCWEVHECKGKFTCRGGVDPDDPDHPNRPEPCVEGHRYADDENPDCPSPHGGENPPNDPGDRFVCVDVFHCRAANEHECFTGFKCDTGEGEGEFVCRYPEEQGFDCHYGEDDRFHCNGGEKHYGCENRYYPCPGPNEYEYEWCPEP